MADGIVGVVLAGGAARRMGGGDKTLLMLGGRPILARILTVLRPQVAALAVSANGDPARFAPYGLAVIADAAAGQGPLGGLLAALDWAAARGFADVLSVPGDAPFLPADLVARLRSARDGGRAAIAASGGRRHPVVGLWAVGLAAALRADLAARRFKAGDFATTCGATAAEWAAAEGDPFLNVNTPADLTAAETRHKGEGWSG